MSTKYTIRDHWDTSGIITAESDPQEEFRIWSHNAAAGGSIWEGTEFGPEDFERYIESLSSSDRGAAFPSQP